MRVTYLLGIYLAFSYIFGLAGLSPTVELIHDLLTLTVCITAYMWLKKNIILFGLAFFFLSFNFELLYSPLIPNSATWNFEAAKFFLGLETVATLLVVAGLADSYFEDKYLDYKSNFKLTPLVATVTAGTVVLQVIIRTFG